MINCNQPQCKKHKTCNLQQHMTPYTLEINYWLKQLKQAEQKIHKYNNTIKDIHQHHKYSTPVNVYGHIKYAPLQNVFGVYIRRPEHIYCGWNINQLKQKRDEIIEKIRNLRLQELRT